MRKAIPTTIVSFTIGVICISIASYADDYAVQLKALTPDYAAPPLDVIAEPGDTGFAATLLGLTLAQQGQRISGLPPRIDGGAALQVKTYWRASVHMDSNIAAQLTFWDHLALIRVTEDFRVGPARGEPSWEAGGVYTVTYTANMQSVTQQFSGDAAIVVSVGGATEKAGQLRPCQLLVVHVTPHVRESNISEDTIKQTFGDGARFIAKRVRMGKGSKAELSIPDSWRDGNKRLAIVSSMSYRAPKQGSVVCEVVLNPGADNEARLPLVSGEATSLCNYDALPPGSANHKKVRVFQSRSSGQVDGRGVPVQLHSFVVELNVPATTDSIQRIAFECDAPVVFDIDGIVLLP